jgi:hypothetical protein
MNCVEPVAAPEPPADAEVAGAVDEVAGAGLVWASATPLARAVETRNKVAVFEIIVFSSAGGRAFEAHALNNGKDRALFAGRSVRTPARRYFGAFADPVLEAPPAPPAPMAREFCPVPDVAPPLMRPPPEGATAEPAVALAPFALLLDAPCIGGLWPEPPAGRAPAGADGPAPWARAGPDAMSAAAAMSDAR